VAKPLAKAPVACHRILKEIAMTFKASFKQMRSSETIRNYAQEKCEKLEKYFNGRISVTWNFSMEREDRLAHCHLTGNNMDYFGEAQTEDLRASIDLVIEKIEKQVRKHKEIVKDHLHHRDHSGSSLKVG
jgi:putative sigma-54 modulation protein